MADEYVGRSEFNTLKEEVSLLKRDMAENQKLLLNIDKKIDVINEKVVTADTIEALKFEPLKKRLDELEENQKWLRRTIFGALLPTIIGVIIFVIKMM